MPKAKRLHRWPEADPDIPCDFCHQEAAIGEVCAGSVAEWVVGAACWRGIPNWATERRAPPCDCR